MVGVGVHVDERRPARVARSRAAPSMSRPSETLTTHSSTVTSVRAGLGSLGRCSSGSRSRSTTTRWPASARCSSRRSSTTREPRRAPGFDSVWLSDHLFLDLAKYGGPPDREACFDPIVTLAALARRVPDVRLGTLVFCEALRPASVLAKALATLDRVSGGRLDVGLGAGWYEPEYDAIGMAMPSPGARLARLDRRDRGREGVCSAAAPFTLRRARTTARSTRRTCPAAVQQPRPRVFVGGKGDRLLRLIAEHADGWNTCWTWTPDAYRERLGVLERACDAVGRDPATVWRSLGLYTLCGEDERDLARRFERHGRGGAARRACDGVDLATFRAGRLVGTVERGARAGARIGKRSASTRSSLGVGAVPFQVAAPRRRRAVAGRACRRVTRPIGQARVVSRSRRRRRMRRRSRSEAPPHTPCSMRWTSAYSRHSAAHRALDAHALRGLDTEYRRTERTRPGLTPRHRAWNIHAYSSGVSTVTSTAPTVRPSLLPSSSRRALGAFLHEGFTSRPRCTTLHGRGTFPARGDLRDFFANVPTPCSVNSQHCGGTSAASLSDAGRRRGSRSAARPVRRRYRPAKTAFRYDQSFVRPLWSWHAWPSSPKSSKRSRRKAT